MYQHSRAEREAKYDTYHHSSATKYDMYQQSRAKPEAKYDMYHHSSATTYGMFQHSSDRKWIEMLIIII